MPAGGVDLARRAESRSARVRPVRRRCSVPAGCAEGGPRQAICPPAAVLEPSAALRAGHSGCLHALNKGVRLWIGRRGRAGAGRAGECGYYANARAAGRGIARARDGRRTGRRGVEHRRGAADAWEQRRSGRWPAACRPTVRPASRFHRLGRALLCALRQALLPRRFAAGLTLLRLSCRAGGRAAQMRRMQEQARASRGGLSGALRLSAPAPLWASP